MATKKKKSIKKAVKKPATKKKPSGFKLTKVIAKKAVNDDGVDPNFIIDATLRKRVLSEVNAIRKACGQSVLRDLPPGMPGDAFGCPIANALNDFACWVNVGSDAVDFRIENQEINLGCSKNNITAAASEVTVKLPSSKSVKRFIKRFDTRAKKAIDIVEAEERMF